MVIVDWQTLGGVQRPGSERQLVHNGTIMLLPLDTVGILDTFSNLESRAAKAAQGCQHWLLRHF